MTKGDITGKLLAALRKNNPAKVRAYAGDDDHRDIAVPSDKRKKWAQVIATIDARSWSRVELLNKAGEILACVDNTSPAGDVEDIGSGLPANIGAQLTLAERIVAMVMKAQRETMTFRDSEVSSLLKAQGDVVREMAGGIRALSEVYREQVVAAEDAAESRAQAAITAAGDNSDMKQLLDAAPQILQLLPALKAMLGSAS